MKKKKRDRAMTHEEEITALPEEQEATPAPATFKEGPKATAWKYAGPADNEARIRMPGDPEVYHPQDLPQRHIASYIASTPENAHWWE